MLYQAHQATTGIYMLANDERNSVVLVVVSQRC
jgi:hypothetical protein